MTAERNRSIANIVNQYSGRLYQFIRRSVSDTQDAEDILQDVWFQLSKVMNLDSIGQVGSWLYRVARNRVIDNYRKKKPDSLEGLSQVQRDDDDTFVNEWLWISEAAGPEMEWMREVFWEQLFQALDELPEAQRLVFVENELEDKTLQQIADEQGEKLKTIISRKRYAVQNLRKKLASIYEELLSED